MPRKKQKVDSRRRTPRQARARNTVEVIFEATAQILQREGRDALTTNRIAERAGVAISTLYQYFRNKEAIVVAFAQREMELHRASVAKAIAIPPADAGAEPDRVAVRTLIDASGRRHRARRIAVDMLIAQGLGDEATGPIKEITRVLAENTKNVLPGLAQPLSPVSLFVLTRAIQGAVNAGLREEVSFYRSVEFENELVRLARGYFAQLGSLADHDGGEPSAASNA